VSFHEEVRPAGPDDLDDVVALLTAWIVTTPVDRSGHLLGYPQRHRSPQERVANGLASEDRQIFVGLLDGHRVGFALVVLVTGMPGGLLARVEELYVEPEAREVGVGESLLDSCVQWATAQGCTGIEVDALPGARSAKNLAERSGFTARLLTLHKRLG
jgi:GNAT superfamily N-acetyltransferase